MAIIPSNFSAAIGSSVEPTSTIANAIWTLSNAVGALGAGSTAYKKLFTATAVGSATLTAKSSIWSSLASGWTKDANDVLNFDGTSSYSFQSSIVNLTAASDYAEFVADMSGNSRIGVSDGTNYILTFGEYGTFLVITDNANAVNSSYPLSNGDTVRIVRRADNKADVYKNGALFFTSGVLLSTGWYFRAGFNSGTHTVNPPAFGGSGITGITSESTTVTVYTPPSITTVSLLPSVIVGNNFSQQLTASGGSGSGTYSVLVNDPAQPVSISAGGLATRGASALGTINFTVRYTDANSAYGSVDKAFSFSVVPPPPAPPIITNKTSLKYGQTGHAYSLQLIVTGGSGSGAWTKTVGNLPDSALSSSGLITIPSVGSSNYTFTVRFTDTNGSFVEKALTIPVSELAYICFSYKQPLARKLIQDVRIFQPIDGNEEIVENTDPKYEFTLQMMYVGRDYGDRLRQFLLDHRRREHFLWYNADRDEVRTVKLMSGFDEEEMFTYGGFQIVLRDV